MVNLQLQELGFHWSQLDDAMDSLMIHLRTYFHHHHHLLHLLLETRDHHRIQVFVEMSFSISLLMVNSQYNLSSHYPSVYQVFVEVADMRILNRKFVLLMM